MAPTLKNKSISCEYARAQEAAKEAAKDESIAREAREAAQDALQSWYTTAYLRADAQIPALQIESNLAVVASIPGWQKTKGTRNGYIMVCSLLDATPRPLILQLNYQIAGLWINVSPAASASSSELRTGAQGFSANVSLQALASAHQK